MKLFHPDQISIDLQMDVERLGRYLVKKGEQIVPLRTYGAHRKCWLRLGLTLDEIAQFLPMSWISDTVRAMN